MAVNRHVRDAIVQLQAGAHELILFHEDFADASVETLATVPATSKMLKKLYPGNNGIGPIGRARARGGLGHEPHAPKALSV